MFCLNVFEVLFFQRAQDVYTMLHHNVASTLKGRFVAYPLGCFFFNIVKCNMSSVMTLYNTSTIYIVFKLTVN